jgi:hypothetical protein
MPAGALPFKTGGSRARAPISRQRAAADLPLRPGGRPSSPTGLRRTTSQKRLDEEKEDTHRCNHDHRQCPFRKSWGFKSPI